MTTEELLLMLSQHEAVMVSNRGATVFVRAIASRRTFERPCLRDCLLAMLDSHKQVLQDRLDRLRNETCERTDKIAECEQRLRDMNEMGQACESRQGESHASEGLQRRQADGQRVTRADRVRYGQDERYPEELANLRSACFLVAEGESLRSIAEKLASAGVRRRNGRSLGVQFLSEQIRWLVSHQRDSVVEWIGEDGIHEIERLLA